MKNILSNSRELSYYFLAIALEFALIIGTGFLAVENFPGEFVAGLWYTAFVGYCVVSIQRSALLFIWLGFPYLIGANLNLRGRAAIWISSIIIILSTAALIFVVTNAPFAWRPFVLGIPFGVVYTLLLYFSTQKGLSSSKETKFRWH